MTPEFVAAAMADLVTKEGIEVAATSGGVGERIPVREGWCWRLRRGG